MNEAPLLLDQLLKRAIEARASDIHIEPYPDELRVRLRIDGLLQESPSLDAAIGRAIISRIKVLAGLNIAECRLPQDGTFSTSVSVTAADIRVATFPCIFGEKVVLRVLDRSDTARGLAELGLDDDLRSSLEIVARSSQGFFLVTGPTGSGKTTTLHAILAEGTSPEKNCVSLEDPVEYLCDGIMQTQVMPEIGFTFEKGLRSLLRQDPDVIMVGEIRDRETAQVALQAALTGHLVLSTLHTSDAPAALIRLMDRGIEPFLIAAAVKGILAQRLARRLCQYCSEEGLISSEERTAAQRLGIILERSFKGRGCSACRGSGYHGRVGIFQLLMISRGLSAQFMARPEYDAIFNQARSEGMQTLAEQGVSKVNSGLISFQELVRVL